MHPQGRINIVHVLHHLMMGGMENGMVNLINQLPAARFRHTVVCVEDCSDFRNRICRDDVEVHQMHRSKIGAARMRWQLWQLFRKLRPDIVHSRNLSGLDALLPARLAGAATLHSEHGFDVDNLDGKASKQRWLRRLHAPLVRHFVTVSQHLRTLLIDDQGIAPRRVTHVCNGVDTQRFAPPPQQPARQGLAACLQGTGLYVIGTVGRLQAIKDQATLLRAFGLVLQRQPGWRAHLRLMLVGGGPLLPALQDQTHALGLDDVVWFAGARHDVPALLQAMDLFVLPSLNEGISNTLLEAMSTALPTLATAVGGNVELVEPGITGSMFAPGDAQGLAALIERHVANPALSRQQGQAARQRVLARFSLQSMVAAYQTIYENL